MVGYPGQFTSRVSILPSPDRGDPRSGYPFPDKGLRRSRSQKVNRACPGGVPAKGLPAHPAEGFCEYPIVLTLFGRLENYDLTSAEGIFCREGRNRKRPILCAGPT
jgi:hypothetical protein